MKIHPCAIASLNNTLGEFGRGSGATTSGAAGGDLGAYEYGGDFVFADGFE